MKKMVCEICQSTKIRKENGIFICKECGTEYSIEEAKKLLTEFPESDLTENEANFSEIDNPEIKLAESKVEKPVEENSSKPPVQNANEYISCNSKPNLYVELKRVFTKEDFINNVVTNFLMNPAIPDDIFDAEFMEVEEFEVEGYIFTGEVEGSYAASVGYDRQEEYTTSERKYVKEGENYIQNGVIKRATTSSTYMVDVRKTRTVTDWQPFSGYLPKTEQIACFSMEESNLDERITKLISDSNLSQTPEKIEFLDNNQYELSKEIMDKAKLQCEVYASIGLYPGDHYKDSRENFNVRIKSYVVFKVPCYKMIVKYNGQEILIKGLGIDDIKVIHKDPEVKEEVETAKKIYELKQDKIKNIEKKYKKRKLLLFGPLIAFILMCIGVSNTAYGWETSNIIYLVFSGVTFVGSLVLFFYLKSREKEKIRIVNNEYEFQVTGLKLNKINRADEFLRKNNMPELDLDIKNIVVENYEEVYKKYSGLKKEFNLTNDQCVQTENHSIEHKNDNSKTIRIIMFSAFLDFFVIGTSLGIIELIDVGLTYYYFAISFFTIWLVLYLIKLSKKRKYKYEKSKINKTQKRIIWIASTFTAVIVILCSIAVMIRENKTLEFSKNPDGTYSLTDCDYNVDEVVIPSTYSGKPVTSIGEDAFSNCSNLTSIVIPDSVTIIGDYAFSGCSNLTSIVIPDSVTIIGNYAFSGCSSLTSITIPDSVTSIGDRAFLECINLTSITIPEGVTSIGYAAFRECDSLTSITIPDSVTRIANESFFYCYSLTSIVIPDSVTIIGDSAFYNCSSLTSVTFEEGSQLTSIESYAFYDCNSLTSIVIPESVTSIYWYAFGNCSSLTMYCEASSEPSNWDYFGGPVYWAGEWEYDSNGNPVPLK